MSLQCCQPPNSHNDFFATAAPTKNRYSSMMGYKAITSVHLCTRHAQSMCVTYIQQHVVTTCAFVCHTGPRVLLNKMMQCNQLKPE